MKFLSFFFLFLFGCVARKYNASEQIINGQIVTSQSESPARWSAVGLAEDVGKTPFCTGSLIAPGTVVSAAHCFSRTPNYVYV